MKRFSWQVVLAVLLLLVAPACDDGTTDSDYVSVDATAAQTPVTFVGDEVVVGIGLEDASVICDGNSLRLRLTLREPLPANAQLNIRALQEAPTTSTDTQEFSPVGDAIWVALDAGSATKIAVAIPEVDGLEEADTVGVYFTAIGSDGVNLQSQTKALPAGDFRC